MAVETTSTLSGEIMTMYESKFLARSKDTLVHQEGLQKKTRENGQGKSVVFNRYTPLSPATTPLTEGSNGTEVAMTSTQVTATLAEYGNYIKIAKLLKLTSVDEDAEEKIDVLAQNMAETIDTLTRDALTGGATVSYAGNKTALTAVAASDILSSTEVKKVRRALVKNKALKNKAGFFFGKIGPDTEYDLIGDSVWVNAHTYKDGQNLYKGYLGTLYGVDFLLTTNPKSEASTTTVYSNIFHGDQAAGAYDLSKDTPKLYVKVPNANDTSNPLDRFSTIGWAGSYVARVLVSAWVYNWKSGATA